MHTQGYDYNLRRRLYCPKLFINDQTIYIPIFRLMQPAHTHTHCRSKSAKTIASMHMHSMAQTMQRIEWKRNSMESVELGQRAEEKKRPSRQHHKHYSFMHSAKQTKNREKRKKITCTRSHNRWMPSRHKKSNNKRRKKIAKANCMYARARSFLLSYLWTKSWWNGCTMDEKMKKTHSKEY